MNICRITPVFNEQDYIRYSLSSGYNVFSKIILVEGTEKNSYKFATSDGLSTDKTSETIRSFMREEDPYNKIVYEQVGKKDTFNELRARLYELIPLDTDYVVVIDADELVVESEMQLCIEAVRRYRNVYFICCKQLMFFQDMRHILEPEAGYEKYMIADARWFKWNPACRPTGEGPTIEGKRYPTHFCTLKELEENKHGEQKRMITLTTPLWNYWHFGWVRRHDKMEEHLLQRFGGHVKTAEEVRNQLGYLPEQYAQYKALCDKTDEELLEYCRAYHKVYTGIFGNERLMEYRGPYPPGIKNHPFWGKPWEWFEL